MPTPLFPDSGTPITIQQGKVGSCYLLAALDCILNTKEGCERIRSMFTQDEYGVTLRIKRNAHSLNLVRRITNDDMNGKYMHFYDTAAEEDVFVVPNDYITHIDSDPKGVQSNSLAIKIIERISAYYLSTSDQATSRVDESGPSKGLRAFESLLEHDKDIRFNNSETNFISDLLGIPNISFKSEDFYRVVFFKLVNPDAPLYISVRWGKVDEFQQLHERHALRVKEVVSVGDKFELVLVNPWDSSKTVNHTIEDIKQRNPRFCFFVTSDKVQQKLDDVFLRLFGGMSPQRLGLKDDVSKQAEMQKIVKMAIEENKLQHGTSAEAKVKHGLALYYYQELPSSITSAAYLRNYFVDKTFSIQMIASLLKPSELLLGAIEFYSAPDGPQSARMYVADSKKECIDVAFLNNMIAVLELDDPLSLFHYLYSISKDNKAIANTLLQLAKDNMPSLFQPRNSFYDASNLVRSSINRHLKKWFKEATEATKDVPGAQDVDLYVSQLQEAIASFTVSYVDCMSEDDVKAKKTSLLQELKDIYDDFAQRPGFGADYSAAVVDINYNRKKRTVHSEADKHIAVLTKCPFDILSDYMDRFNLFPSMFDGKTTDEQILQHKKLLLDRLHALRTTPELLFALKNCNEERYFAVFKMLYESKIELINETAAALIRENASFSDDKENASQPSQAGFFGGLKGKQPSYVGCAKEHSLQAFNESRNVLDSPKLTS